ncbi:MAG TPA: hypothetical protein VLK65_32675 [Vicinamibacteria bacterium]|nr:hypothetical protein [Vicinamibacteria bacterium]
MLSALAFCGAPSDSIFSPNSYSILDGLRAQLQEAHAAGDADAIATMFDPAGSLQLPQEPAVVGRASIRSRYAELFEDFLVNLAMFAVESSVRDGRVVDRGTFNLILTPRAGGPNVQSTGEYSLAGYLGDGGVRVEELRFESAS